MSGGSSAGGQKNYGSMSTVPNIDFMGTLQFSPTELYSLSENITTNIYTINTNWKNLERALKSIGTERDNQGLRDQVHVTQLSCNQIVGQTTRDLQRLNFIVRRGDKQQKLQVDKLTNDFKEAVQYYSKMQKQVAERMKVCLLRRQSAEQGEGAGEEEEGAWLDEQAQLAAQKTRLRDLEFDTGLLAEREHRIRRIEGDVLDVNQIMRELAAMVHEQGDALNTIESNIENVHGHVEEGTSQLQRAAQYQNKYRKKVLILALVAVVVAIIVTIVVLTQLKR
ncbi:syntaxin-12 [Bacillus rossius redtenbacheri]|uniref:syntaxin-12 n=1 Tax=Bacillus rossius redtenbacheri TaxID=93214 RepID=UPI002FDCB8D2